jgi:hypothetical protein
VQLKENDAAESFANRLRVVRRAVQKNKLWTMSIQENQLDIYCIRLSGATE